MKKSYKKFVILFFIILLGVGIYFVWKQIKSVSVVGIVDKTNQNLPTSELVTPTSTRQGGLNQTNQVPNEASGTKITISKISDIPIFDFWINKKTGDVFYLSQGGGVFLAKDGKDGNVSDQQVTAINYILETPSGEKTLVVFGNPHSPQWGIFDSIDKVWRPLPSNISSATWGRNEDELIVVKKNASNSSLGFLDLKKTPPEFKNIITSFSFKDVRLSFISPNSLFITELPSSKYVSRAWLLDIKSLSLNVLNSGENDLFFRWSQDKSFVFGFGLRSGFGVFEGSPLSNQIPLPFSTIPQKCAGVFSTIYCFIPQNSNRSFFDDYMMNKNYSSDFLYIENSYSGNSNTYALLGLNNNNPVDAKNPRVFENKLYFINKYDNFLYKITGVENSSPVYKEPYD